MSKICTIMVHACIGVKPTCPHCHPLHIDITKPAEKQCRFKCLLTETFYTGSYPFQVPDSCRLQDVVDQSPEAI